MANPPPPYDNITGISRTVMKDNAQETLANYDGNARPGEIVMDLTQDPPTPYVGNNAGQLTLLTSAGSYGNTQVAQFLTAGLVGNITPAGNGVNSLGNSTNYWANLWVAANTLYIGGVPVGVSGNTLTVNGTPVGGGSTGNITFTDTTMSPPDGEDLFITAANSEVAITALDFRVEATDDVRITGNDTVSIRNTSNSDSITIVTDYNGAERTWEFGADGTLETPGDIIVAGDISGTSGASTLYLKADPSSGTYIELNDTVDSTISTVANLEIRTGVIGTDKTWRFDTTGNLTTPSNLVISPISGSAGTNITQIDAGLQLLGEGPSALAVTGWAESTAVPANVAFIGFNSPLPDGAANVLVVTGDQNVNTYSWNFDLTGNLTVPGNVATPSGTLGFNGNRFTWGLEATGGFYTVDLTAGDPESAQYTATLMTDGVFYLPVTAAANISRVSSEINNANANLLLQGGDSVKIISDGTDTGKTWTFDSAGNLSLPSSGYMVVSGGIVGTGASPAPILSGFQSGSFVGNVTATRLQNDGNLEIRSNVAGTLRNWTFDTLGDLNLPAGGNISGSGYVTAIRVITDPQPLANLTAVAGARAFVSDGNLVAAGNFGAQIGSGGANTVPVWSDGTNWYVG